MIVMEFSMYPIGSAHISDDLGRVVKILKASGLEFEVGPMSTSISGEWDEIFATVKACHMDLAKDHERVICHITVDDKKAAFDHLRPRVEKVERKAS